MNIVRASNLISVTWYVGEGPRERGLGDIRMLYCEASVINIYKEYEMEDNSITKLTEQLVAAELNPMVIKALIKGLKTTITELDPLIDSLSTMFTKVFKDMSSGDVGKVLSSAKVAELAFSFVDTFIKKELFK